MSTLNEIQHVLIMDKHSSGTYRKLIDGFKPKGATKCFICVEKLEALVVVNAGIHSHNLILSVKGADNTYINTLDQGMTTISRSSIIDSYLTTEIVGTVAMYRVINSQDKWIQLSMDQLNHLEITFRHITDLSADPLTYSDVDLQYFLHLKVKFE